MERNCTADELNIKEQSGIYYVDDGVRAIPTRIVSTRIVPTRIIPTGTIPTLDNSHTG